MRDDEPETMDEAFEEARNRLRQTKPLAADAFEDISGIRLVLAGWGAAVLSVGALIGYFLFQLVFAAVALVVLIAIQYALTFFVRAALAAVVSTITARRDFSNRAELALSLAAGLLAGAIIIGIAMWALSPVKKAIESVADELDERTAEKKDELGSDRSNGEMEPDDGIKGLDRIGSIKERDDYKGIQ